MTNRDPDYHLSRDRRRTIGGGRLDVGAFEATFHFSETDAIAELLGSTPFRHEVRVGLPVGAARQCPACLKSASAVVFEDVTLAAFGGASEDKMVTFKLAGVDPAAYRCEPCGHRFDRNGKEIDA